MKPKLMKVAVTLVTIMAFMSLLVGEYVYPLPDDTDNLPWYLRKDKQMDAATAQGQASSLEVDRRNAVAEDVKNQDLPRGEVKPDLKQKKSAGKETTGENLGDFFFYEPPAEDADIYIPEAILKYLTERGAASSDYIVKFDEETETYKVVWIESKAGVKSLVFNSFDKAGNAVNQNDYIIAECTYENGDLYLGSVKVLPSGTIAVIWSERDSVYNYSLKVKMFNAQGEPLGGRDYFVLTGDRVLSQLTASDVHITLLSNGNLAVIWREKDTSKNYSIRLKLFDQDGNALNSDEKEDYILTQDRLADEALLKQVVVLENNRIVIIWNERVDGQYVTRLNTFNQNGQPVHEEDYVFPFSQNSITILANGDIAVIWRDLGSDGKYYMKITIFNHEDGMLNREENLSDAGIEGRIEDLHTVLLNNGNIAVIWLEEDETKTGYDSGALRIVIVDSNGERVEGMDYRISEDTEEWINIYGALYGGLLSQKIIVFANGNIGIIWDGWGYYHKTLNMSIYDPTKDTLNYKSHVFTGVGYSINEAFVMQIKELPNGYIAVVHTEQYEGGYHNILNIFDQEGNFALTDDFMPEEIGAPLDITEFEIVGTILLSNGNIGLILSGGGAQHETIQLALVTYNPIKHAISYEFTHFPTWEEGTPSAYLERIERLPNGNFIVIWREDYYDANGYDYRLHKMRIFDPDGNVISKEDFVIESMIPIALVTLLSNGNIAIVWQEVILDAATKSYKYAVNMAILDEEGNVVSEYPLSGSESLTYVKISIAFQLSNGDIFIAWRGKNAKNEYIFDARVIDENGKVIPTGNVDHNYGKPGDLVDLLTLYLRLKYDDLFRDNAWTGSSYRETGRLLEPVMLFGLQNESSNNTAIVGGFDTSFDYADLIITPSYKDLMDGIRAYLSSYISVNSLKSAINEEENLEDIIKALQGKDDKTNIEEGLLEAARTAMLDAQDIDKEKLDEFEDVIRVIKILESMEGLLEGVDFMVITKALASLVDQRQTLYRTYINDTKDVYVTLEKLLSINIDEDVLPDRYLTVANINRDTKRKLLVDIAITDIEEKGKRGKPLNEHEKEALKLYKGAIKPVQNAYRQALTKLLDSFILKIKETISGVKPASTVKEDNNFKAIFRMPEEE